MCIRDSSRIVRKSPCGTLPIIVYHLCSLSSQCKTIFNYEMSNFPDQIHSNFGLEKITNFENFYRENDQFRNFGQGKFYSTLPLSAQ